MANIVQRNLHRSLAKSLIAVEKETGIPLDRLVKLMNDEFGYVDKNDQKRVETLENQMELDVAAELHAKKNNVSVSETAVAHTALRRKMGTLSQDFKPDTPNTETT